MADSLGINNDVVLLPPLAVVDNPVNQRLLIAVIPLWKQDILRTVCKAAP